MEHHKDEKSAPWMSVPQFGDWDQMGPLPDYSLNFSKIREMKKQNKMGISRASIDNEAELISSSNTNKLDVENNSAPMAAHRRNYGDDENDRRSPMVRRSILSYFNCCVKA